MLEAKVKEVQEFKVIVDGGTISKSDLDKLNVMKRLGVVSTPEYQRLSNLKEISRLNKRSREIEPILNTLEKEGFKIVTSRFLEHFKKEYSLVSGSPEEYVYDIPTKNLLNIKREADRFMEIYIREQWGNEFLDVSTNSNWNLVGKEPLYFDTKNVLEIIAPEEHFNRDLKIVDPDPVAVLRLDEDYYLYLDAWDLEKFLFDVETDNPELLN